MEHIVTELQVQMNQFLQNTVIQFIGKIKHENRV
jgi:hypothetical protein